MLAGFPTRRRFAIMAEEVIHVRHALASVPRLRHTHRSRPERVDYSGPIDLDDVPDLSRAFRAAKPALPEGGMLKFHAEGTSGDSSTTFFRHFICSVSSRVPTRSNNCGCHSYRAREHARGFPSMRALVVGLVVGLSALTAVPPAMAGFSQRTSAVRRVRRGKMGFQRGRRANMSRHRRRHHVQRPHRGRMARLHRRPARRLRR